MVRIHNACAWCWLRSVLTLLLCVFRGCKPLGTGPGTALPQQDDGSSCGVFICAYAEALTRGVQPDDLGQVFSSPEVDSFRKQMACDMLRGFTKD